MARVIRRRWQPDLAAPSRHDGQPCEYEAYVPDLLVGRAITLQGEVAADIAEAAAAIARFDAEALSLSDTEALARILLRAESVASSRIEGLEIGARRLLRAEAATQLGEQPSDVTASEVLANIDAMSQAVHGIAPGDDLTVDQLLAFHRRLLSGTRLQAQAGKIRTQQNWIGGSDYNPCAADFVPPPHELVEGLLDDLCAFCNGDDLPAVAQAAIAHAQFETIHPFVDGNGRTGRALIHLVLRRRGLALRVLPPVSLILATWARDYVTGLAATRYRGAATSRTAQDGLNLWLGRFAAACRRAVDDAASFETRAQAIELNWRDRVGRVRAQSATDRLLGALLGAPVVSVNSASELIGRSFPQTNEAIGRLVEAGILTQITVGRRNRAFEASEIVDAFADLERQLASPEGNTRVSEPARRVPHRRAKR
ncbi:MAG: filamentation induced by cAMP protein Fic [Pseudonocardiales bacterium]|nr:filamentation induced by cAMP protein Fic [Pseudonocardiales bacterium]